MGAQDEVKIVGGGSKSDLMVQPFDIGRISFSRRPRFMLTIEYHSILMEVLRSEIKVVIDGYVAANDSGHNWYIWGHIDTSNPLLDAVNDFKGFYNTRIRTGYLKPWVV